MLILLDIHRNILSGQTVFKCFLENINCIEIILKPSNLIFSTTRASLSSELSIIMPKNFVRPHSVSSVCYKNVTDCIVERKGDATKLLFQTSGSRLKSSDGKETVLVEILFRFQILSNANIEDYISNKFSTLDFKTVMIEKYVKYRTCNIYCTECGVLLTKEILNFHAVHKYYEGMSELAETSFCHKHDNHNTADAEIKNNLLFIGNMYFYFHFSLLDRFMIAETDKEYKCSKCSSILSFKKKTDDLHYIGFFSDKVMLTEPGKEVHFIEKYKVDTCLLSFSSLVEDFLKSSVTPKLYFQSKVGENVEVLLLFINSQKVLQFLLHEKNNVVLPSEVEFKGMEVFKVLYCCCSPESEISKKWKHDFSVEFFQISDNMMQIICNELHKSSEYFPETEEVMKGFTFGYLPGPDYFKRRVIVTEKASVFWHTACYL